MIKIIMGLIIILLLAPLYRYYYLDTTKNDSIITNQIRVDVDDILTDMIAFIEQSHSQRH